jgi:hypothetical protein
MFEDDPVPNVKQWADDISLPTSLLESFTSLRTAFGSKTQVSFVCAIAKFQTKEDDMRYLAIGETRKLIEGANSDFGCFISSAETEFYYLDTTSDDNMNLLKFDKTLKLLSGKQYALPVMEKRSPIQMIEHGGDLYFNIEYERDAFYWKISASNMDDVKVMERFTTEFLKEVNQDMMLINNQIHILMVSVYSREFHFDLMQLEFETEMPEHQYRMVKLDPYAPIDPTASSFYDTELNTLHNLVRANDITYYFNMKYPEEMEIFHTYQINMHGKFCRILGVSNDRFDIYFICNPTKSEETYVLGLNFETDIITSMKFRGQESHITFTWADNNVFMGSIVPQDHTLNFFLGNYRNLVVNYRFDSFIDFNDQFTLIDDFELHRDGVKFVPKVEEKTQDVEIVEHEAEAKTTDLTRNIEFNEDPVHQSILSGIFTDLEVTFSRYLGDSNAETTVDWSPLGSRVFANLALEPDFENNMLRIGGLPFMHQGGFFSFILRTRIKTEDEKVEVSRPVHLEIIQCMELCRICETELVCATCRSGYSMDDGVCVENEDLMIYIFPIFTSLAVVGVLALVIVLKYHWHLMHNLVYHFQMFAIFIILFQTLTIFRNANFLKLTNIFPLLLIPFSYYVLPFIWLFMIPDWEMDTFWKFTKVYSIIIGAFTAVTSLFGSTANTRDNAWFRFTAMIGFSFVKGHYITFFACVMDSFYNVKQHDVTGYDIAVFCATALFIVCALASLVRIWLDSGKILNDKETLVKFNTYPFFRDYKQSAMSLRYHVWMFLKLIAIFVFIFLIWIGFDDNSYGGNTSAVAFMGIIIGIEVVWLVYICVFRPAVHPDITIAEIVNFIFYLAVLGLVMYKLVDQARHGSADLETHDFYVVLFSLGMPFAYAFLVIWVLVSVLVLKKSNMELYKRPSRKLDMMTVSEAESTYVESVKYYSLN